MSRTIPWPFGSRRPGRVVAVPSEQVLILALPLARLPASQRAAAALFAAEPHIAQPLEEMRVVMGPQLGPEASAPWLVVVAGRATLDALRASPNGAGRRLVPDALLLARPGPGQWTVAREGARLVARLPDGTGFAAAEPGFRAVWAQSGRPAIAWVAGAPLPDLPASAPAPAAWDAELSGFDLAGDRLPDWRRPSRLAALAVVLVLGLGLYLGLLAHDAQRLALAAAAREAEVRQALTDRGIPVGPSVDAAAAEVLHGLNAGQAAGFLPLLSTAFDALSAQTDLVTLQDISFDSRSGRLSLTLIAPELAALQDASALLTGAGFTTDLGTSTISDGQARATVNLTRGGAAG